MIYPKCILLLMLICCNIHISAQSNYQIILQTNFDGDMVEGSIDALIEEIRKGKPVRIGWQLDFNKDKEPDFEHWVDAGFLTVLNGHVFAQIERIYRQIPNAETPQIEIVPNNMMWTGVLGTNSKLLNRWVMEELEYDVDDNGNPIITDAVEKGLKHREVKTWDVATFWSVPK